MEWSVWSWPGVKADRRKAELHTRLRSGGRVLVRDCRRVNACKAPSTYSSSNFPAHSVSIVVGLALRDTLTFSHKL